MGFWLLWFRMYSVHNRIVLSERAGGNGLDVKNGRFGEVQFSKTSISNYCVETSNPQIFAVISLTVILHPNTSPM